MDIKIENIKTKICSKCNVEKLLNEFDIRKDTKNGYRSECKECRRKIINKYNEKNKDILNEKKKIYYIQNKESFLKKQKIYYENNKEQDNIRSRNYHQLNKNTLNEKSKQYYNDHRDILLKKMKISSKRHYEKNKEKILKSHNIYYVNNKERKMQVRNIYRNKKRKIDPIFALTCTIRSSIYASFKKNGYKKTSRTHEILGCTFKEFKTYIESRLENWMTWDNYGKYNGEINYGWDIDHIIPISIAKTEEDVINLNHYTNLQPLCSKINRDIKKSKYDINPSILSY